MEYCIASFLYFVITTFLGCTDTQFNCGDICIDNNKVCNNQRDCPNGEDEKHCSSSKAMILPFVLMSLVGEY